MGMVLELYKISKDHQYLLTDFNESTDVNRIL